VIEVAGLELASVIRQLRAELNEALADADGQRLRFQLGPVEMTLTMTVGREAGAGGKIRFWVVEADTDAKLSRETVQDIKLVLTPVDTQAPLGPGGKAAAPLITGRAVEGED
jgi:NTP-dependent ternary system trypsin peptidase co-occuring protein